MMRLPVEFLIGVTLVTVKYLKWFKHFPAESLTSKLFFSTGLISSSLACNTCSVLGSFPYSLLQPSHTKPLKLTDGGPENE
jgi:hypothetical protein